MKEALPIRPAFLLLIVCCTAVAAAAGEQEPPKRVNLNTATVEELEGLPGIGEAIAKRIVRHREKSGRFRTVEELLVVRGISEKKLEKLQPLITVTEERKEEKAKKSE